MAKRRRRAQSEEAPGRQTPPRVYGPAPGGHGLALATLGGVVVLLMISFSNWREIDRIDKTLGDRLRQIESRLAEVSGKVDKLPAQAAAAAQPARRGPDPDRVYQIQTAGAPSKGPANAPITIAEFSDFQ